MYPMTRTTKNHELYRQWDQKYRKKHHKEILRRQREFYWANHERMLEKQRKLYHKHAQKRRAYSVRYHQEHKNQDGYKKRRQENYQQYIDVRRKLWRGELDSQSWRTIWRKAQIFASKILVWENFTEILSFPQHLYVSERYRGQVGWYDYLAKRDGKIFAIEVTIMDGKLIRPLARTMAQYLNLEYVVLFIKPDLSAYYFMPVPFRDIRFQEIHLSMKALRSGLKPSPKKLNELELASVID